MKAFFSIKNLAIGTVITILLGGLAFILAIFVLGNVYYASIFLPVSMLACLSVAWFSFLKGDGLGRRDLGSSDPSEALPEPGHAEPTLVPGLGMKDAGESHAPPGQSQRRLDTSMFAPRDSVLVPRAEHKSATHKGRSYKGLPGNGRAAFVWAAIELGALATLLYATTGLGASFYL